MWRKVFGCGLLAAFVAAASLWTSPALAQCATFAAGDLTCTNPAGTTVSGGTNGIITFGSLTITNFGTVTGTDSGILTLNNANVTNAGAILGGAQFAIEAFGNATIVNSGLISVSDAGFYAINVFGTANISNSGTISGPTAITGTTINLVNSGTIIGTSGIALNLGQSFGDTLVFLPGSRIIGDIGLGVGDTVTVRSGRDISWLLNFGACNCGAGGGFFDTGSTAVVTGGSPYVITGNQIAILDPTALSLADRSLSDFTGNIASLLATRFSQFGSSGGASAFAASSSSVADAANVAFAGLPGAANAYAAMPNATSVDPQSGIAVWSKGFFGRRHQDADGPNLGATTVSFGGAMGVDRQYSSIVRLGAFLGAGHGHMDVDSNSQTVKTDYVFGGVYGRADWSSHFVDATLSFGHGHNDSTRIIANNLVAGGIETATAQYNGWFISPELAYGVRIPLSAQVMLTPAARLRYTAGFFDGYSEAGSAQTLSVSSRTVQNLEERFELAFTYTAPFTANTLKTTATIGVLGMERVGGTAINAILIGQSLSFAATGQNNATGAYAGLAFDLRLANAATLFAAAQVTAMNDDSWIGVAQAGLRIAF